ATLLIAACARHAWAAGIFLCMREERGHYLEGCANLSSRVASRVSARKHTSASRKQITPDRKLTVAILRVGSSLVSPRNSKIIVVPIRMAQKVSKAMQLLTSQPR